jgi:transforming growth factor-beta-induced protein
MKFSTATAFAVLASISAVNAQTVVDIIVGSPDHTTLTAAVGLAGLGEVLATGEAFTVFAPTDTAFAALPPATLARLLMPEWIFHLSDVLLYHAVAAAVPSSALTQDQVITMANTGDATITSLAPPMINQADIVTPDRVATNGFVHVTDGVLLPPSVTTDIVGAAAATESLSTLVSLVTIADLVGALQGEGPFTVFAPTNDAFAAIDADTMAYLSSPEGKDDLINILTYHVYPGIVHSSTLADGEITMLNGDMATVDADMTMIENAKVIDGGADILVSNGIVHLIDAVIVPPVAPAPTSSAGIVGSSVAIVSVVAAMFLL